MSNPLETRSTLSLYIAVEGRSDVVFLTHIRRFADENHGLYLRKSVRIEPNLGMSAPGVVNLAGKSTSDHKIAMIDCDRLKRSKKEERQALSAASTLGVTLQIMDPCLEAVLLAVAGDPSELAAHNCESAKMKIGAILRPRSRQNIDFAQLLTQDFPVGKLIKNRELSEGLHGILEIFEI